MVNFFNQHRRSGLDRRTGEDRRKVISLDYFDKYGVDRRSYSERRTREESRKGWVRVSKWSSVFTGDNG